jgi:hypothetical protein
LEAVPNGAGKKTQDLFEMFQHTFYAPI